MFLSIFLLFCITSSSPVAKAAVTGGSLSLWEEATGQFFDYLDGGVDKNSTVEELDLSVYCTGTILFIEQEQFKNIMSSIPHVSENMLHEICSPYNMPDSHKCDFLSNTLDELVFQTKSQCLKAGGIITPISVEGKCTEGINDILYQSLPACGPVKCTTDDMVILYEAVLSDAFDALMKEKVGDGVECTVSVKADDDAGGDGKKDSVKSIATTTLGKHVASTVAIILTTATFFF